MKVRLNSHFLRRRSQELDIKREWFAHQLSISSRTLYRWMSGQVGSVTPADIKKMSHILSCHSTDLIISPNAESYFASPEDVEAARKVVVQQKLWVELQKCGRYSIYEKLVKSLLQTTLSKLELAELHCELARAFWSRCDYELAHSHVYFSLKVSTELDNKALKMESLLLLTQIANRTGKMSEAIAYLDEAERQGCLSQEQVTRITYIKAQTFIMIGKWDEAIQMLRHALFFYQNQSYSHKTTSIYYYLVICFQNLNDTVNWEQQGCQLMESAKASGHLLLLSESYFLLAELWLSKEDFEKASSYLANGEQLLKDLSLPPKSYYTARIRLATREGRIDEALKLVNEAEQLFKDRSYFALLRYEAEKVQNPNRSVHSVVEGFLSTGRVGYATLAKTLYKT